MQPLSIEQFADRLNEVIPLLMKEFASRQVTDWYKEKISLPQFLVLANLYQGGEGKMTDLASAMKVSTAAMTGVVNRLVRDGFARRKNDETDRRVIKILLTAKGSALVDKINQQRRKMVIDIFGRISENDRQDYLRVLSQVKEILERNGLHK